jgi:MtN3 and saliva related transmembrane protein
MSPPYAELVGAAAAVIGTLAWVPQALKTIRTRQTRDISLITQSSIAIALLLWLVYGVMIGSWPLIAANVVTFTLVGVILVLKVRHG